jgi:carbamoyl-phosphate synthase large subunit
MREEGVTSVLVNSNPATIMTDEDIADAVYIEPLTVESVAKIIEKERPDGLLPTLGGQTGLNLAVELADSGILDYYGVRSLGTPIETIRKAESRELFKELLASIGEPAPPSFTVTSFDDALKAAFEIGFPVIIRPSFTLGGSGGGTASDLESLRLAVLNGLAASPIHEVLIEKSVAGWKEIEYEVMRDAADNCVTICNMENIDPMGVHTGDSIVIAPTQTLTNKEYQMLRSASLKIIRQLGIEGGCNIQFALDPQSENYYVIEVNPRVSRSSALASKATGYPIARVASKIAIGKRLDEIPNKITGKTMASFEPALDYVVVKIPRWPFDKFASGERRLGVQMKSTGEAMAIGRTFEAAFQKAVRSLEFGNRTLLWEDPNWKFGDKVEDYPLEPTDLRLWIIMTALRRGVAPQDISTRTGIDVWFIEKMKNIVAMEKRLLSEPLTASLLLEVKQMGFSDEEIGTLADKLPDQVRNLRKIWQITPVYKMVDTCAGEFEAQTPYFYSTYDRGENEAPPLDDKKAMVIGSGPIRIGQGIEFDYCSVHSAWALREEGWQSIMVNSNPETVSTDFDTSDRLYFEALDKESLQDIAENESRDGVELPPAIVQFGGQTAINVAGPLYNSGIPISGSSIDTIDLAEDRRRFEAFINRLGMQQAPGATTTTVEEAIKIADLLGYPVLVRPSYVLGGRAMEIVHNPAELTRYMKYALDLNTGRPVLIDKFLQGKEVEIDAVADGSRVFIPGIMEHIERAGVHSGDSIAVYPPKNLTEEEINTIVNYSIRLGLELGVKGLMNIQFAVVRNNSKSTVYVIEVNPRASRTVPFISKVTGVPLAKLATRVMLGRSLEELGYETGLLQPGKLIAVKAPVFSMSKLSGVDTYLGPEMKSTGEVMGVDFKFELALYKALLAAGLVMPAGGSILLSIADRDKAEALPLIKKLNDLDYNFYATEGTSALIEQAGMDVKMITKKLHEGHPNVVDIIKEGKVDGVVNTVTGNRVPLSDGFEIRRAAVERRIPCYTSLDTLGAIIDVLNNPIKDYHTMTIKEYRQGC